MIDTSSFEEYGCGMTSAKERHWKKKREMAPEILCACGCGEKLKSVDNYGRTAKFINGHNKRIYHGKDSTSWAREKRWRVKNPNIIRENKKAFYRRRKLIAMKILGNKCSFCSKKYSGKNSPIFEFHHIDPKKKDGGITRMLINKAWEKTLKELKRCVLTCANCHNQIHGGEW